MQTLIKRINELAAKNKTVGLTQEEISERDSLRREYIKKFREKMKSEIIDNMYIVDENGNKTKISKKADFSGKAD